MHPRTVKMAAEVASQFSDAQIDEYGNIIQYGYISVVPNSANKKAWQYQETATAPVDLPSLTQVRPAFKGWTTNYMQYYTQLQPNGYGVNPGDPTMFEFDVHSFTKYQGPIVSATYVTYGKNYVPGTYVGVATTTNGVGFNATVDFVVNALGDVSGFAVNGTGSDYSVGDTVEPIQVGQGGSEPIIFHVTQIEIQKGGEAKYAQPPVRRGNAIVPQADNVVPPPIGNLGL
jgi:hypothetical protein